MSVRTPPHSAGNYLLHITPQHSILIKALVTSRVTNIKPINSKFSKTWAVDQAYSSKVDYPFCTACADPTARTAATAAWSYTFRLLVLARKSNQHFSLPRTSRVAALASASAHLLLSYFLDSKLVCIIPWACSSRVCFTTLSRRTCRLRLAFRGRVVNAVFFNHGPAIA